MSDSKRDPLSEPLRIGWASPINAGSAIGRVSADVADGLIDAGHQVRVIATERYHRPAQVNHATKAEIFHWSQLDLTRLAEEFDVVVVNVGDNFLFHAGIFPLMDKMPCVGVFHDFYNYDLFLGWLADAFADRGDPWRIAQHDQSVIQTYGPGLAEIAARARRGELSLETLAERMPMAEWVARRCGGALAHADFYADRLLNSCAGPVEVAPMPFRPRKVAPLPRRTGRDLNVLTVGVMNPNKCAAEVIEAIAGSESLRRRTKYRLAGPIEPGEAQRLTALAASLGFEGLIIDGAVDDRVLEQRLEEADIICCLRRPVLEGSSGSAIEAMMAGRPAIMVDDGFYAELPDDLVFKLPPDFDVGALTTRLEALAQNEPLRRAVGARASHWALDHFSLAGYVDAVSDLLRDAIAAQPLLSLGRGLGQRLRQLGLDPLDPAVGRIADEVMAMFGDGR
jgi:glycosyltransferase involved in cell wall biosynthesis